MLDEDDEDGELFSLERKASEAEERGPRVDVPTVRDPSASLPDASSVDPAVQRPFWMAVIYANVALMGVSLGAMLIAFRGQWRWGGAAAVVGVLAGIRVYQTYRAFERRDRDDGESADGAGSGDVTDNTIDGNGPSNDDSTDDDPSNDDSTDDDSTDDDGGGSGGSRASDGGDDGDPDGGRTGEGV